VQTPILLNRSEGRKHQSEAIKKKHLNCLSIKT